VRLNQNYFFSSSSTAEKTFGFRFLILKVTPFQVLLDLINKNFEKCCTLRRQIINKTMQASLMFSRFVRWNHG